MEDERMPEQEKLCKEILGNAFNRNASEIQVLKQSQKIMIGLGDKKATSDLWLQLSSYYGHKSIREKPFDVVIENQIIVMDLSWFLIVACELLQHKLDQFLLKE